MRIPPRDSEDIYPTTAGPGLVSLSGGPLDGRFLDTSAVDPDDATLAEAAGEVYQPIAAAPPRQGSVATAATLLYVRSASPPRSCSTMPVPRTTSGGPTRWSASGASRN
ncbi:hypothetical protein ACFRMQ_21375 [Kitasatospora sp. NPDC056783]|uniref:hypothetical protein n=1 Tax=Kitasatospora sp. NPDC056783 TaxID=3345943 RepID=UPI0036AB9421